MSVSFASVVTNYGLQDLLCLLHKIRKDLNRNKTAPPIQKLSQCSDFLVPIWTEIYYVAEVNLLTATQQTTLEYTLSPIQPADPCCIDSGGIYENNSTRDGWPVHFEGVPLSHLFIFCNHAFYLFLSCCL